MNTTCDLAPPGWYCTREPGHRPPCAAWPLTPGDQAWLLVCDHLLADWTRQDLEQLGAATRPTFGLLWEVP